MNLTFNLELDSKANKKGEKLLMIRATENREHKRINTGIRINPKFWNKLKKQVKRTHHQHSKLNKVIAKKMEEVEQVYLTLIEENNPKSLSEFFSEIQRPRSVNFFQFAVDHKLNHFKANNKLGTFRRYEAVLNKMKEFAGESLTVKQIDYTLLRKFEEYLLGVRKNGRDTASSNLSVIRSIVNEAIKHGHFDKRNPFDSITLRYTDNTKNKLTIDELRALNNAVLPNIQSLHIARDFFMACFYAGGCRGGDMVTMRWENLKAEKLIYTQHKTGKSLALPLLPQLLEIFTKYKSNSCYIFPLLKSSEIVTEMTINSRLTYINKYLKEVCKYAGILKKISSHCARHTFSDISLELNQNDVYALKGVLGHSSVKTTEGYLINRNYDNIKEYLLTLQKLQISD